jgi:hypothetical protein
LRSLSLSSLPLFSRSTTTGEAFSCMRNPTVKEAKLSLRRQESSTRDSTRLEEGLGKQCQKERASYAKEKERSMDLCLPICLSVSLLGTFQGTQVTASSERSCVAAVSRTFSNQRLRNLRIITFVLFYFILFFRSGEKRFL